MNRKAAVCWRRLAGRRGVRPLLRGTYPHSAFRRGVRCIPARGASLVASPASLESRRARRNGDVVRSPPPKSGTSWGLTGGGECAPPYQLYELTNIPKIHSSVIQGEEPEIEVTLVLRPGASAH